MCHRACGPYQRGAASPLLLVLALSPPHPPTHPLPPKNALATSQARPSQLLQWEGRSQMGIRRVTGRNACSRPAPPPPPQDDPYRGPFGFVTPPHAPPFECCCRVRSPSTPHSWSAGCRRPTPPALASRSTGWSIMASAGPPRSHLPCVPRSWGRRCPPTPLPCTQKRPPPPPHTHRGSLSCPVWVGWGWGHRWPSNSNVGTPVQDADLVILEFAVNEPPDVEMQGLRRERGKRRRPRRRRQEPGTPPAEVPFRSQSAILQLQPPPVHSPSFPAPAARRRSPGGAAAPHAAPAQRAAGGAAQQLCLET